MDIWMLVALLAERQHGVIALWQLRLLGITDEQVGRRLRREGWRVLAPGVYRRPGVAEAFTQRAAAAILCVAGPTRVAREVERLRASGCSPLAAVHLAAFGGALVALTGEAAAHGRQLTTGQPGTIQVASRGVSGRECPAWITASQAELASCDAIDVITALPMVFVPRLLADLSASWKVRATRHRDLVRLAAAADGRRALSQSDLDAYLQSRGRFVGAPVLRRVAADLAGTLSHSSVISPASTGSVPNGGGQHWTADRHPTEEVDHDLEGFKRSVHRELRTLLERYPSVAIGLGGRSSVRETSIGLGGRS